MNKGTLQLPKNIYIISIICFICGCSPQTGIRNGQVFNAVTNEPIQGAVVAFSWHFTGAFNLGPIGGKYYETLTDKDGKYFVPNQTVNKPNFMYGSLEEQMLIYKDGFDVNYIDFGIDSIFSTIEGKKNNVAKLVPMKEGRSYYYLVSGIDAVTRNSGQGELLKKELEPAKKRAREDLAKDVEAGRKRAEQERAKKQTQK